MLLKTDKSVMIKLILCTLMSVFSLNSWGFSCQDASGNIISDNSKQAVLYVNVKPQIQPEEVLVINLAESIGCSNSDPSYYNDYVKLTYAFFSGGLDSFTGSLDFYNSRYELPLNRETKYYNYQSKAYEPMKLRLLLTPVSLAGGVVIHKNDTIATVNLHKHATNKDGEDMGDMDITWTVKANNDVIIPTGGCDVSSRDITVTLPEYPAQEPVNLTVYCAKEQQLSYFLSGKTVGGNNNIFENTAQNSPASGLGIQLLRNRMPVSTTETISLGKVSASPVPLGLMASYARTNGPITAGNVQSVIGVTFTYP